MHTCEVCDTPLDGTEQDEPITHAGDSYRVCSYTCETVLYDRFSPSKGRDRHRFAPGLVE